MSKPNKYGWIRHRGGKCPVDKEAYISARFRSGETFHGPAYGLVWDHRGIPSDVMSWKQHVATVKVDGEPGLGTDAQGNKVEFGFAEQLSGDWKEDLSKDPRVIDMSNEPLHAGYFSKEMPRPQHYDEDPIAWRGRIKEIDATTDALATERADLISKLAAEGFALIEPIAKADSAQVDADMSDWSNWRVGDKVVFNGEITTIKRSEIGYYKGSLPWCVEGGVWPLRNQVKWHSSPGK